MSLILMSVITLLTIILIAKHIRGTAICMDMACKYNKKVCCKVCDNRRLCEAVCEYRGECDWREYQ